MRKKMEGSFRGLNPGPRAILSAEHPKRWDDVSEVLLRGRSVSNDPESFNTLELDVPNHTTRPNNPCFDARRSKV